MTNLVHARRVLLAVSVALSGFALTGCGDTAGSPPEAAAPALPENTSAYVMFFDQYKTQALDMAVLQTVQQDFAEKGYAGLAIVGFHDPSEPADTAQKRVLAVANSLVGLGIPKPAISIAADSNGGKTETEFGDPAVSRRVEIYPLTQ